MRSFRSKPSDVTFAASSSAVSSNERQTPGSSYRLAPCTRNCIPSSVLPHPALPQTRVGRPRGRPPSVISSRPRMPVGHLRIPFAVLDFVVFSTPGNALPAIHLPTIGHKTPQGLLYTRVRLADWFDVTEIN